MVLDIISLNYKVKQNSDINFQVKEFVPLERRATKRSVYELESDEEAFPPKSTSFPPKSTSFPQKSTQMSLSAKTVSKRIEEQARRNRREMEQR